MKRTIRGLFFKCPTRINSINVLREKHRIKFTDVLILVLTALTLSVGVQTAHTYDLPSVNLGMTSFLDGGPPAGPGWYFEEYLQLYTSDQLTDPNGNAALPNVADEDLSVWVAMSQLIYQSNQKLLLGGKWGINFMLPIVGLDMGYGMENSAFPQDNGSGIGDFVVGPYLQWDPIMGKNGPKFMHRIELAMIFPTGDYDENKELNPGSNFFSFNPYWAATLFITPKLTASTRLHYLWNGENDDPNRGFGPDAEDTQAGQAFHANFTMAYEIIPRQLRIGINGYYLTQLTDTQMNSEDVPDRKEQVFGIGPGIVYHFSQDDHLFFNAYFESQAENRPEGERFNLRWVHHF